MLSSSGNKVSNPFLYPTYLDGRNTLIKDEKLENQKRKVDTPQDKHQGGAGHPVQQVPRVQGGVHVNNQSNLEGEDKCSGVEKLVDEHTLQNRDHKHNISQTCGQYAFERVDYGPQHYGDGPRTGKVGSDGPQFGDYVLQHGDYSPLYGDYEPNTNYTCPPTGQYAVGQQPGENKPQLSDYEGNMESGPHCNMYGSEILHGPYSVSTDSPYQLEYFYTDGKIGLSLGLDLVWVGFGLTAYDLILFTGIHFAKRCLVLSLYPKLYSPPSLPPAPPPPHIETRESHKQ